MCLDLKMVPCKKVRGTAYHDSGRPCQCGLEHVTASHTQQQHSWEPCRFLQQSSDSLESTSNQAVRNLPASEAVWERASHSCDALVDSWTYLTYELFWFPVQTKERNKDRERKNVRKRGRERKTGGTLRKKKNGEELFPSPYRLSSVPDVVSRDQRLARSPWLRVLPVPATRHWDQHVPAWYGHSSLPMSLLHRHKR